MTHAETGALARVVRAAKRVFVEQMSDQPPEERIIEVVERKATPI
ncbi:MAG TPA: hypothetical protein VHB68_09275 [Steroidobacteraceae bacterium]|nr:hypothetical protein [Steroidobacteraceae bacterium]